jgi:hypothetical protein
MPARKEPPGKHAAVTLWRERNMAKMGMRLPKGSSITIADTREHLQRLDRQDWWRWITVIVVTFLLTTGVFLLSLPGLRTGEQSGLNSGVAGLFAIIIVFDVFAVYQQSVITRLRRELMRQVAMSATLEMLRPPDPATEEGRRRPRKFQRFHFDQRVSVTYPEAGKERRVYGRSSDISEGGLGAVIPESLEPGTKIVVELTLGADAKLVAPAVVLHRRGFHHCIEFVKLSPEQAECVHSACVGATPALDFYEFRGAQ